MPRAILIILGLLALASPKQVCAAELGLAPGAYDELLIGFNPATRRVTGYFSSETGQGHFTCIFYLRGTLEGSQASISTYYPATPSEDLIKGQLLLNGPKQLEVRLPTEHGGCWNVEHFADRTQPASFGLRTSYPWTYIAVVKADKAYFFDAPGAATHRKGYLVQGDGVGVRSVQPGWLQVDFVGGSKAISGWIRQSDTYPAE